MTDQQNSPETDGRKITAEDIERARKPLERWLRSQGDSEAEDTASDTVVVLIKKYLGDVIQTSVLALAKNIAGKDLRARRATVKRRGTDTTEDMDAFAVLATPESEHELNTQKAESEAFAKEYAARTGRTLHEIMAMHEDKKVVSERGRWRRPEHYFEDEEDQLREATIALELIEYEKTWGKPWDPDRIACLEILTAKHAFQAAAEKEARKALADLRKALLTTRELANATPCTIEGKATLGGAARQALVVMRRPNQILLDAIDQTLDGPAGYLDSELHNFVGCTFTRPDYARALGCTRKPTANELATIWLLCGAEVTIQPKTWAGPKHKGEMTPAQYREKMRDKVAEAVKHYENITPIDAPDA